MYKEALDRTFRLLPQLKISYLYGSTESTANVSTARVLHKDKVTIDHPKVIVRRYALQANLQPDLIGKPGELHIVSAGVARGFLGRPYSTINRFISSPFSDEPGVRSYKKGGRILSLPDGNNEFLFGLMSKSSLVATVLSPARSWPCLLNTQRCGKPLSGHDRRKIHGYVQ
jgi:non-ribosomal peptide synthetase component F